MADPFFKRYILEENSILHYFWNISPNLGTEYNKFRQSILMGTIVTKVLDTFNQQLLRRVDPVLKKLHYIQD